MLTRIRQLFGINDTSYDHIIQIIVEEDTKLIKSLNIDEAFLFSMAVSDFSEYLKEGGNSFQPANPTSVERFPEGLQKLMMASIKAKTF